MQNIYLVYNNVYLVHKYDVVYWTLFGHFGQKSLKGKRIRLITAPECRVKRETRERDY